MALLQTFLLMHRPNIRHVIRRILDYREGSSLTGRLGPTSGWMKHCMVQNVSQTSLKVYNRFMQNSVIVYRTAYNGACTSMYGNHVLSITGNQTQKHSFVLTPGLPECNKVYFHTSGPDCLPKVKDSQEQTENKTSEELANYEKDKGGDTEKDIERQAPEEPPKGIVRRFKDAYKEYGKVLICVHVATSAVWFGSFYYAASSGLDVVPLLEWIGLSDNLIKPFKATGIGHVAVAYLLYKLATPARYTVTVGGTQLTVRQLRQLGYMKPVPKEDSLRQLWKDSSEQIKDKAEQRSNKLKESAEQLKERFRKD